MQTFSLYKAPHPIHNRPGVVRFLLEADDLYVYLWVQNRDILESFQIVFQESVVLTFREGRSTVGLITREPFNRIVVEDGFADEKKKLLAAFSIMRSKELPHLLRTIQSFVTDPSSIRFPILLADAETRLLSRMERIMEKNELPDLEG